MSVNSTDIKRNDGLLAVYTLALKNINFFLLDECLSEAKYDNYISLHSKWFGVDSEQRTRNKSPRPHQKWRK